MQILSSAEMGAADRRTAEEFGVPLAELMENAGGAVAGFCLREYPAAERVVVLCGRWRTLRMRRRGHWGGCEPKHRKWR
jgi:NAD(P)H-hydrate epimerase